MLSLKIGTGTESPLNTLQEASMLPDNTASAREAGYTKTRTTVYHPPSDEMVERFKKTWRPAGQMCGVPLKGLGWAQPLPHASQLYMNPQVAPLLNSCSWRATFAYRFQGKRLCVQQATIHMTYSMCKTRTGSSLPESCQHETNVCMTCCKADHY